MGFQTNFGFFGFFGVEPPPPSCCLTSSNRPGHDFRPDRDRKFQLTGTGTEIINLPGPGPIISILPGPRPTIQSYRDRDDRDMTGMTGTKTGILILKAVSCNFHLHYLSLYFTLILEQV